MLGTVLSVRVRIQGPRILPSRLGSADPRGAEPGRVRWRPLSPRQSMDPDQRYMDSRTRVRQGSETLSHKIAGIEEYNRRLGSIRSKTLQKLCILYWCIEKAAEPSALQETLSCLNVDWVAKLLGCKRRTAQEYVQALLILTEQHHSVIP